ncbi:hypothetical protein PIB30_050748 [Stylosanthes scabra]|uniref:Uncharacterized protein n=1 Tax=Stylosanthes scabra TaxID=79078 RepID=A0ABU6SHL8_9FABA|nr:hypothetical protein [Stylosanthes scabra]
MHALDESGDKRLGCDLVDCRGKTLADKPRTLTHRKEGEEEKREWEIDGEKETLKEVLPPPVSFSVAMQSRCRHYNSSAVVLPSPMKKEPSSIIVVAAILERKEKPVEREIYFCRTLPLFSSLMAKKLSAF